MTLVTVLLKQKFYTPGRHAVQQRMQAVNKQFVFFLSYRIICQNISQINAVVASAYFACSFPRLSLLWNPLQFDHKKSPNFPTRAPTAEFMARKWSQKCSSLASCCLRSCGVWTFHWRDLSRPNHFQSTLCVSFTCCLTKAIHTHYSNEAVSTDHRYTARPTLQNFFSVLSLHSRAL